MHSFSIHSPVSVHFTLLLCWCTSPSLSFSSFEVWVTQTNESLHSVKGILEIIWHSSSVSLIQKFWRTHCFLFLWYILTRKLQSQAEFCLPRRLARRGNVYFQLILNQGEASGIHFLTCERWSWWGCIWIYSPVRWVYSECKKNCLLKYHLLWFSWFCPGLCSAAECMQAVPLNPEKGWNSGTLSRVAMVFNQLFHCWLFQNSLNCFSATLFLLFIIINGLSYWKHLKPYYCWCRVDKSFWQSVCKCRELLWSSQC